MEIPLKVREAMKVEAKRRGNSEDLGVYKGKTVWSYSYADPVSIGYPFIYLFDGRAVEYLCDQSVFDIISQLEKS